MTADPKPRRRRVLEGRAYRALVAHMLDRHPICELCGIRRSQSAHHVVPRGQGGDDVEANLSMLCGHGTEGCHGRVEHSVEARHELRPKLRAETMIYVTERKGRAWLDRRYPSLL